MRKIIKATAAALAAAGLVLAATSCTILGGAVKFTPSIQVIDKASEHVPEVEAQLHLVVLGDPPQTARIEMTLAYYSPGEKRWIPAGSDTLGDPWRKGEHALLVVVHQCVRSGLKWRMHVTWHGRKGNGDYVHGSKYWPRTGVKLTCD